MLYSQGQVLSSVEANFCECVLSFSLFNVQLDLIIIIIIHSIIIIIVTLFTVATREAAAVKEWVLSRWVY